METEKSRSESPLSRGKTKYQYSDAPENGNLVIEQLKAKKKSLRSKSKSQSNGKENEDITENRNDFLEEKPAPNETVNTDTNNAEEETKINNGHDVEITNGNKETQEVEDKENNALINDCEVVEDKPVVEFNHQLNKTDTVEESMRTNCVKTMDVAEDCSENITETESYAKEDNLLPCDLPLKLETEENCNPEAVDAVKEENFSSQEITKEEEEIVRECSKTKDSSQISVNGSEGSSHYEEANTVEDYIQASPDTATNEEQSLTNKITTILGKWSYLQEQKEDLEVSSSKESETILNHPYLSKVSGRKGIKERLNSSATVFSSKEMEAKTPEHMTISLDDSFRVRTNPPSLSSVNLMENPTLRKFKGKRCLNTGEPDDDDEMHTSIMKRRKLDKTQESGILGSILWSPFKKKSLNNEDQLKLATTESKLSRLLSPFWFWKKTASGQNGK